MIQDFDDKGGMELGRQHLPKLRKVLQENQLDGFMIPHEDEYQNEYIAKYAERLAWLTGFTGSAGLSIVLKKQASIFVDERYTLQVKEQVDPELFSYQSYNLKSILNWLRSTLKPGDKIGYDPMLFTVNMIAHIQLMVEKKQANLIPIDLNPIDQIWKDQPEIPSKPVFIHDLKYTGKSHHSKLKEISNALNTLNADCVIITSTDSIAWLLNIRGNDINYVPITFAYAILYQTGHLKLFIDQEKISKAVKAHLGNKIALFSQTDFFKEVSKTKQLRVCIDPSKLPVKIYHILQSNQAKIIQSNDFCTLPKACKNSVELKNSEQIHILDGAAVTHFIHWIKTQANQGIYTEINAVKKLESFRRKISAFKDLSFDTISAFGAHGALAHYKVTSHSASLIKPDSLYLVDSGAQYYQGTTDITRTLAIGTPTQKMCFHYTYVLKAHIMLARARFPKGTNGHQLDSITRLPLWMAGLDYGHGTGHGIGSYLSVHEGPQRLSKSQNNIALQPGMIISNEPGYYQEGEYGIRIENLQYVMPTKTPEMGDTPMHDFKILTFAPLEKELIDLSLLTDQEINWVNQYHQETFNRLLPHINKNISDWFKAACSPL